MTARRIGFGLLWLGFIGYAFVLAPPDQPDTLDLIEKLSTGNWQGINPLVIALFNVMGIWPLIYCCVVLVDGEGQDLSAWPFAVTSFGVGAFALIPYLALRQPNPKFTGSLTAVLQICESRITAILLTLGAATLVIYGLTQGNWQDFTQQWQTSRFIHVMSLDFCLLCLLFPAFLGDDMSRRSMNNRGLFWAVTLIPLFGPLAYLLLRPSLEDGTTEVSLQEPSI
ncbi:MAG: DUF2834 domain-containing protein [Microcoleaceae cyanobacterium]